jgi:hypothetical protein
MQRSRKLPAIAFTFPDRRNLDVSIHSAFVCAREFYRAGVYHRCVCSLLFRRPVFSGHTGNRRSLHRRRNVVADRVVVKNVGYAARLGVGYFGRAFKVAALVGTSYGRLLLLKITLFAGMVCLAGINREYLLPRLSGDNGRNPASRVVQWLLRNTLIEIALGIGVILIVGMLGIMAPATGMHGHVH